MTGQNANFHKKPCQVKNTVYGIFFELNSYDDLLSTDFVIVEFGNRDEKERFRRYRRYLYEKGAIKRSDGKSKHVISDKVFEKERENNFEISKILIFE